MEIKSPYLLFLGDVPDQLAAKTAMGIVDWRRDWCVGQLRLPGCGADTGLPDLSLDAAREAGAQTLVIGIVNAGGTFPDHWTDVIVDAMRKGFDIASGLHRPLQSISAIEAVRGETGSTIFNVRLSEGGFATGRGTKRIGRRLLTVGTDCSVGKKYAALALEKAMHARGLDAEFRATGQTGILISGRGVAIDAVIADFISGAAEWISPANHPNHWDVVEGQGSLFHPSFAGVSLGLLHGTQPDAYVVCHEPTRTTMRNVDTPLPTIRQVMDLTETCGRLTNPDIRCVGIAINTAALSEQDAHRVLDETEREYSLPTSDPVRFGVDAIIDKLTADFSQS